MATIEIKELSATEWTILPEPAFNGGYSVDIYDVDASTTGRNQAGTMIRDRVAVKRKVNCKWNYIKPEVAQELLNAVKSPFFNLRFDDPMTGGKYTGTFYVGDRSVPYYSKAVNGAYVFIDTKSTIISELSMNFIER